MRFDPILTWREGTATRTNLSFFEVLANQTARLGIGDIRFSFAQWYRKSVRRTLEAGMDYVDPPREEKIEAAAHLAEIARGYELRLHACAQPFIAGRGILRSACIDGRLLSALHPRGERATGAKDGSQRSDCGCTKSVDIGSYAQACPHGCLYCYAQ